MTNQPVSDEHIMLDEGQPYIQAESSLKVHNATTFRFNKEDHTLGNLLRHQLLRDPVVHFAGYSCPHPSEPYFLLRIQTDGSKTPQVALQHASEALLQEVQRVEGQFDSEVAERQKELRERALSGGGGGGGGAMDTGN